MAKNTFFEVITVNGLVVRTTEDYWQKIIQFKHPIMLGREEDVKLTLQDPDEIRQSKQNEKVLLYYRQLGKNHLCVVAKKLNGEGFVITTYITDRIKEGRSIWRR